MTLSRGVVSGLSPRQQVVPAVIGFDELNELTAILTLQEDVDVGVGRCAQVAQLVALVAIEAMV